MVTLFILLTISNSVEDTKKKWKTSIVKIIIITCKSLYLHSLPARFGYLLSISFHKGKSIFSGLYSIFYKVFSRTNHALNIQNSKKLMWIVTLYFWSNTLLELTKILYFHTSKKLWNVKKIYYLIGIFIFPLNGKVGKDRNAMNRNVIVVDWELERYFLLVYWQRVDYWHLMVKKKILKTLPFFVWMIRRKPSL